MAWLSIERTCKIIAALLVGVALARYLGPDLYGRLSFLLAIIGFASIVVTFGTRDVIVQALVLEPERASELIGSTFLIQILTSLGSYFFLLLVLLLTQPDAVVSLCLSIIMSSLVILRVTDVCTYWYEARVNSRPVVIVQILVTITFVVAKIAAILLEVSFEQICYLILAEGFVLAMCLLWLQFFKTAGVGPLAVAPHLARDIVRRASPLLVGAVAGFVYMKIDQIMLGYLADANAVGIYSAAVTLSEGWFFIPAIITASIFPKILSKRESNKPKYLKHVMYTYKGVALFALFVAIAVSSLSQEIVALIYGESYKEAAGVLIIHVWGGIFVSIGVVSSKFIVAEHLQRSVPVIVLIGALLNIALNLVTIPRLGVIGAAYSTLLSCLCVNYFFLLIPPRTRKVFFVISRSLFSVGNRVPELSREME